MSNKKSKCLSLAVTIFLYIALNFLYVPGLCAYPVTLHDVIQTKKLRLATQAVASFPLSLLLVEDEAFEGTSIDSAVFERGLIEIGNRAFASSHLKHVYIPQSTNHIGTDAFPHNSVVHGIKNSYAEVWAKEENYNFVRNDVWNTWTIPSQPCVAFGVLLFCILLLADLKKSHVIRKHTWALLRSMRPQDRIELYPINYRFP